MPADLIPVPSGLPERLAELGGDMARAFLLDAAPARNMTCVSAWLIYKF